MFIVGIGSGMFNSPNTAAMMGTVAPHRRGIAAGARVLVQNTGAVISIAFVLAIVTSAVPKQVLFAVFSGLADHISNAQLVPFISNMHTALWCLCAVSIVGAVISAARPKDVTAPAPEKRPRAPGGDVVSATADRQLRIGEVAELTGTTPRTIRYYEEIGLLDTAPERAQGKHRVYTQADVDRVREIIRLRDLLGLSLEQLSPAARGRERPRAPARRARPDRGPDRAQADPGGAAHPHLQASSTSSRRGSPSSPISPPSSSDKQRKVRQKIREIDAG